ncbi:Thiosulfate sulfurtransferase GlpE [Flavobacterium sp. CECT 9288]|uniref:thioredoxin domain-containing protein n=1 Tax=Flavobacterium sp. CECT 9288 TaxID=2845819 RepID=UPI001E51DC21|nr:thioredoxin domain-containing protein [Flavobacterium sp. CECT 9288]CAH0335010.1 Thiosulfate sulfurtransferase GlpE [Flavobacterium sp. CECT 9288]
MKPFKYIVILACAVFFTSCNAQETTKTIDAKTFSDKIAQTPSAQIIDVRTPQEFSSYHLDNAINIDWLGNSFEKEVAKLDPKKPVFIYCKSGGRSQSAHEKLNQLGFTTVYEMKGGILKWEAAGLAKSSDKVIGMTMEEYTKITTSDKKVLINFYAEWCAPCKKMAPYIKTMQTELANDITIIRIDADKNKTLMSELKISELPTLLFYEGAKVKWQKSGYITEVDLKKQIQ